MKMIAVLFVLVISFSVKAQTNSSEFLKTATYTKIDTTIKSTFQNISHLLFQCVNGAAADSIKKAEGLVYLFFGNFKITLYNQEDYLTYLTRAIHYAEKQYRLSTEETRRYYPNINTAPWRGAVQY